MGLPQLCRFLTPGAAVVAAAADDVALAGVRGTPPAPPIGIRCCTTAV